MRFLHHILGIGKNIMIIIIIKGKNIASDNLRAEASSPAYHTHWVPLIFRLWNISTLFMRKGILNYVGVCPKTAQSKGYTICNMSIG